MRGEPTSRYFCLFIYPQPIPCSADLLHPAAAEPYRQDMLTPREEAERAKAAERTRSLMRAAAAAFPGDPYGAQAWLLGPHPDLLGATPVAAAWFSDRLANFAQLLLEADTSAPRTHHGAN